jgi:ferredoxin
MAWSDIAETTMATAPVEHPAATPAPGHGRIGIVMPVLSLLLLAAHFLRFGNPGLCVALAGLAMFAATRRAWVRLAMAAALAAGLPVWAAAWADFLALRLAAGLPWVRLSLILAAVVGLNAAALFWLLRGGGRRFFDRGPDAARLCGGAFVLSATLLGATREAVRFPILLLDRFAPGWGWLEILLLSLYAAWVAGRMADPGRSAAARVRIWRLFSLVFFLQLLIGLAGVRELLMTGALHLPVPAVIVGGPLFRGGGYFMPILFAATLVLVGPAWCSHLCYIGAWDDALSRLRRRPATLPAWARHGRWLTLAAVALVALLLRLLGASPGEAAALGGLFGVVGVGVMATASRRLGIMAHCTAYCPIGALSNLLGKLAPWRVRIDSGCTRCGRCTRACRYGALAPADIERGRPGFTCTLCGDCLGNCRERSIGYRFPGLSGEAARRLFVATAASLHAVFLGVARM